MSPDQTCAKETTEPPFHRAFSMMLNAGRDLLSRLQSALTLKDTSHLPPRFARNTLTSEQRVSRTLDWIVALARTLAGDRTWLIVPTYAAPRFPAFPSLTADLRREIGLPALPPRTEAQKATAHRWYVRKVFATQPVAQIAARLARRLDIAPTADAWPTDLMAITQTPAAYAKRPSPSPSWGGSGWGAVPPAPPPDPTPPPPPPRHRPTVTSPYPNAPKPPPNGVAQACPIISRVTITPL